MGNKKLVVDDACYEAILRSGLLTGAYSVCDAPRQDTETEDTAKSEYAERLHTILEHLGSGITAVILDETGGKFLFANERYYELLGYAREEYEKEVTDHYQIIHPDDRERVKAAVNHTYSTGECVNEQYRVLRRDGVTVWLRAIISMCSFPGVDKPVQIAAFYDVTEQIKTEARLKLITESIPGGLASFACAAEKVRLTYCNSGFCELFGISREEYEKASRSNPLAFVFEEDKNNLKTRYYELLNKNVPIDCVYRIHVSNGGYKWVHHCAVVTDSHEGTKYVNAALFDITERQNVVENLRVSEEENRLAMEQSGNMVTKYDVRNKTLVLPAKINPIYNLPRVLLNVPEEQIALGRISPESAAEYTEFYASIARGSKSGVAVFQQRSENGWRWLRGQYTTVFSSADEPVSAVITFADITEQLEKEVVYNKWQQSLDERPDDSYTLFRCNLSKGASYDSWEGKLLTVEFEEGGQGFNERTREYVEQCVYGEDAERYTAFMNSDTLLANYYRGHRSDAIEYREINKAGEIRWLRLSVDLVEYPNSRDVEVYLMFENIDEQKKAELLTRVRSETDPLTGVLNRSTFIARVEEILRLSKRSEKHALFLFDVDDFKHINDTYGHSAGDEVLRALTDKTSAILRHDDLIGRLGGDEFFVFLRGIKSEEAAAKKAEQICSLKMLVPNTADAVTVSMGVAMLPESGKDFETIYKKVDAALYEKKRRGKGGFLFA